MTYNPLILRVDKDGHLIVPEGVDREILQKDVTDRIDACLKSSKQPKLALDRGESWGSALDPHFAYIKNLLISLLEYPRVVTDNGKAVILGGEQLFLPPKKRRLALMLEMRGKWGLPTAINNLLDMLNNVSETVRSTRPLALDASSMLKKIQEKITEAGDTLPESLLVDIEDLRTILCKLIKKCSKTRLPAPKTGKGPGKHGWITVRQVAEDFGTTPQTILNWEKDPDGGPYQWSKALRLDIQLQGAYKAKKMLCKMWKNSNRRSTFIQFQATVGLDSLPT